MHRVQSGLGAAAEFTTHAGYIYALHMYTDEGARRMLQGAWDTDASERPVDFALQTSLVGF